MVDNLQNIESLKEEIHNIKLELNAWKEHAKDSDEKLEFLDKQNGPINPAEAFYNPVNKRIIEKLGNENLILRKQVTELTGLENINTDTILKEREKLRDEVKRLKCELEIKYRENQRLQKESNDNEKKRLLARCSQLQMESGLLKSSLMLQNQTNTYIKECVDTLRDEFLEIFLYNCKIKGEEFIQAVKELDSAKTNGLPKSLLTPLRKSQATETEPISANEKIYQEHEKLREDLISLNIGIEPKKQTSPPDSAVGTLDDERIEINSMLREIKEENERLKKENNRLKEEINRLADLSSNNPGQELIDSMIRETEKLNNDLKAAKVTVSLEFIINVLAGLFYLIQ